MKNSKNLILKLEGLNAEDKKGSCKRIKQKRIG